MPSSAWPVRRHRKRPGQAWRLSKRPKSSKAAWVQVTAALPPSRSTSSRACASTARGMWPDRGSRPGHLGAFATQVTHSARWRRGQRRLRERPQRQTDQVCGRRRRAGRARRSPASDERSDPSARPPAASRNRPRTSRTGTMRSTDVDDALDDGWHVRGRYLPRPPPGSVRGHPSPTDRRVGPPTRKPPLPERRLQSLCKTSDGDDVHHRKTPGDEVQRPTPGFVAWNRSCERQIRAA